MDEAHGRVPPPPARPGQARPPSTVHRPVSPGSVAATALRAARKTLAAAVPAAVRWICSGRPPVDRTLELLPSLVPEIHFGNREGERVKPWRRTPSYGDILVHLSLLIFSDSALRLLLNSRGSTGFYSMYCTACQQIGELKMTKRGGKGGDDFLGE